MAPGQCSSAGRERDLPREAGIKNMYPDLAARRRGVDGALTSGLTFHRFTVWLRSAIERRTVEDQVGDRIA